MNNLYVGFKWAIAVLIGAWVQIPELTQLLVLLMAVDIILGIATAVKGRNVSSKAAWDGMTKKVGELLLIGVAALLNPHIQSIIQINLVQAASAFYIVPELLSISRNAAILDIPVFTQLTPILRYFQSISGQEKESTPEARPIAEDPSRTSRRD